MKTPLCALQILLLILAVGCNNNSPNGNGPTASTKRTITGEMFILLESGDTKRLSLVEVFLISRDEAVKVQSKLWNERLEEASKMARLHEEMVKFQNEAQKARQESERLAGDEARRQKQGYDLKEQSLKLLDGRERRKDGREEPPVYGEELSAIQKTTTDAAGQFQLTIPTNDKFLLFAKARLHRGNGTVRHFCWLLPVPEDQLEQKLLLTQQNAIPADFTTLFLPLEAISPKGK